MVEQHNDSPIMALMALGDLRATPVVTPASWWLEFLAWARFDSIFIQAFYATSDGL